MELEPNEKKTSTSSSDKLKSMKIGLLEMDVRSDAEEMNVVDCDPDSNQTTADEALNKKRRVNKDVQAYIELTETAVADDSNEVVAVEESHGINEVVVEDKNNQEQIQAQIQAPAQLPVKKRRTSASATQVSASIITDQSTADAAPATPNFAHIPGLPSVIKEVAANTPNNFDLRWRDRLNDLRAYKAIHGNTLVSKSNNFQLGKWVARQRQEYKKLKQGKKSCMTEERIKVLEEEGFVWVVREPYQQVAWDQRFSELVKFLEERGTTIVPKNLEGYYQLSLWCMNQRQEYRKCGEGKKHKLTEERIEKLNSIGFVWVVKGHDTVSWELRFNQLKEYKAEHGHCNVPQNYKKNAKLAEWVEKMRNQYKRYLNGDISGKLTVSRVALLESEGFDWNPESRGVPWETRYAELCDYQDKYKDCNVREEYLEHQHLRTWVNTQRWEYKKMQEGKPNSMTEGRIKLLERISFEWGIPQDELKPAQAGIPDAAHTGNESMTSLLKPAQLETDVASALPATAATLLSMELVEENNKVSIGQSFANI